MREEKREREKKSNACDHSLRASRRPQAFALNPAEVASPELERSQGKGNAQVLAIGRGPAEAERE